jgi:hypothetical protein
MKNKSKGRSELKQMVQTKRKLFFKTSAAPAGGSRYQKPRAAKTKAMLTIKYALNLTSEKKHRTAIPKERPKINKKKPQKWRPEAVIQVHLKWPFSGPTHINKRSFIVVAF